jgi:hypothetical protein
MHGYLAFYRNKQIEIYAETAYEAQQKAIVEIQATLRPRGHKWKYEVYTALCEKDCQPDGNGGWLSGEQVVHVAT